MVRKELIEFVKDLSAYLERPKQPVDKTIDLWLKDCERISSLCLPYLREMMREIEAWPKNFPKFLWGLYHSWLQQNPDKKHVEELGCSQCHEGFISVSRYAETDHFPDWVDLVYRCGICNGSQESSSRGIPAKTRQELLEMGYFAPAYKIRHPCHKPFPVPCSWLDWQHPVRIEWRRLHDIPEPTWRPKSLDELVNMVAGSMELPF